MIVSKRSGAAARRISRQGPTEAYKRVKQAMQASFGNSLQEQLLLEGQLQGQCGRTRDFKEGVMAFLEKRPATFDGR
jgi:2-(1,2-epoxy-1,2-dihydrophenyl)acetyl-CoA isomerase